MQPLSAEDIARIDREFLRSQERDRIIERMQIWAIFISLASGFGYTATQSSELAYLAALYPILLDFLSMHVQNSEETLSQIRKYLYKQEVEAQYTGGYEHFTRAPENRRTYHGGYKKALRGAFCTTQALATGAVLFHLFQNCVLQFTALSQLLHSNLLAGGILTTIALVIAAAEAIVTRSTWQSLTDQKKHRPQPVQNSSTLATSTQG